MSVDRRQFLQILAAAAGAGVLSGIPLMARAQASGGVLNVVVQPEPPGIMIGIYQNVPSQMVGGNIFEGLLRFDADLKPHPLLAESWEEAPDGMFYSFKLKENVLWHDGKPFTSEDVVFSLDKMLRETHPRVRNFLTAVESITADGPHKVDFRMKHPFAPFIQSFEVGSMPMLPKHLYEGTDYNTNPVNNAPIGTGPLKFAEWQRGSYLKLVANESYHEEGVPSIDAVYFHVIPDGASRATAYETGKVDVLPGGAVEYFDVQRLAELPNSELTTKGWEFQGSQCFLWLNNGSNWIKDKRVRQAIMYALDRESMRDIAFFGYAKVAPSPWNSSTRFYSEDIKQYPRDVEKAKALLSEAGYDGSPIRLLPLPYGETWQRLAEIARENLIEAGIQVELTATDVAGWNQRLGEKDYDIAFSYMSQYGDPALGVARLYTTSNIIEGSPWNNVSAFSNTDLDALFDAGAVEIDPEKRAKIYHDAQALIAEEVPLAWLFEMIWPTIYRANIKNLISSAVGLNDSLGRARIE